MYFRPPQFIRRMFPSLIWSMPETDSVYLTFDDGPTPGVTEFILDRLAEYDAKATFFCLGKNAEQHPHLFRMIVEGGHRIGNHTYSHQKGWNMSLERYLEDVDFANGLLRSDLFRPPYGRITPMQARRIGERYHIVMWDVLSRDYSQFVSPRSCLHNVTRHVRGGSIVAFHDSVKSFRNMRYALPRTLEYLREKGLKCAAIEL
ncbi:polysaccharide deacetylase family protein [uncultured Alistipes sp.]|uniref:polysaccharide deacetylase family protein n=1 Tax=uncultured Alistipes sp. TaxID=538949 RepID=UPI00261D72A6|nr:polysaccharide deacetylase family protein [uncultured Alistipes sp.]